MTSYCGNLYVLQIFHKYTLDFQIPTLKIGTRAQENQPKRLLNADDTKNVVFSMREMNVQNESEVSRCDLGAQA